MSNYRLIIAMLLTITLIPGGLASEKKLLWGDTHLHTSYSFDAFLNNNLTADPDTAFRWAKGQPVIHPYNRTRVQIDQPLDFLVVSDHAEFLGALRDVYYNGIEQQDTGPLDQLYNWYATRVIRDAIDEGTGADLFGDALPSQQDPYAAAASWREQMTEQGFPASDNVVQEAWQAVTTTADAHNQPGKFTSFIGWEWSSTPGGANLHRVVFTDAAAPIAQTFIPYGSNQSPFPDDLWRWLEQTSATTGAAFMSMPHNSNLSKGLMFSTRTLRNEPMSAEYAQLRARWERVVEMTQIKGDSETHPSLSPDDAFADFEEFPYYLQRDPSPYKPTKADYVRSALGTGLTLESSLGVNPFQFGFIGSTDSHTGLASPDETNFWGKMATDSVPENKAGFSLAGGPSGWTMAAQGLAAVWAEENTRESIMAAFKRREVYATTGPRIRLSLHGHMAAPNAAEFSGGVAMGGELTAQDGAVPTLAINALRDPQAANLDRIQVIKGWRDANGDSHERIYDVAWSGERAFDAAGVLAPVGNTVDLKTGRHRDSIGAAELAATWRDPDFNPMQSAFYYVRVLQIPTARHGLLDALALGETAPLEGPATIQERAYSSPIWYRPGG